MIAIIFNSLFPITWIVISAVLVLGMLGWLEVKRRQKLPILRVAALFLAVFSIVCLILRPALSIEKSANIILLTTNYNPHTLDSLLDSNPKSQVYKLQGAEGPNTATEIKNYRNLSDLKGNIFLLGEGLPQYMFEYVNSSSLQYFPSLNPEGFSAINSDKLYTVNQPARLEGIINIQGNKTVTLTGPASAEDSIHIQNQNSQPFSLKFTPKAPGQYLYALTVSDSSGKINFSEQVPVQVKAQKSLSILFLSDFPSAEIRFLKNFLETENHKLTLRYKISKDKYRTEFINTPQKSIGRLNKELLQHFDLVLVDASSLSLLSTGEIQQLKEDVKNGLGILTLINTPSLGKQANDLLNLTLSKIKNDSAQLLLQKKRIKIPATSVSIVSPKKTFAVQQEPSGRIISGYQSVGLGKSGFQLLSNTFSLALLGEKEAYAEIWSPLIQAVSRKEIREYDLQFTTSFPYYSDEPIDFKIIGGTAKPTVTIDSMEIPIIESPLIKNLWIGKMWATQIGWNTIHIDQDSSNHSFFVSSPESWKSLQVNNQLRSMKKIVSKKGNVSPQTILQPVPKIIFFLLFLVSAGFLWLAPKL